MSSIPAEVRGHGTDLPTVADIIAAHLRIAKYVHRTPVLQCSSITRLTPHRQVYLKCENFQKVGAFKIRGGTNAILQYRAEAVKAGKAPPSVFVTHSSGNHAQAIAKAAAMLNCESHIIMPSNAPKVKAEAVRGYGGHVHECEPTLAARESTAAAVLAKFPNNSKFVHPYDDGFVIAGQGTLALELLEQTKADGPLDAVVVPVGGGGMITGVSIAIKALSPNTKVFAAEPLGADDTARSFAQGTKVAAHRPGLPNTMADGLLTINSQRTFAGIKQHVDGVLTVTEQQISAALRLTLERAKIVIEPSAAVGVAAVLAGFPELRGMERVAVVICGGNIELDRLAEYLNVSKSKL